MSTTMDMEEQQPPVKKSRMDDPSSKEESTEIAIQNDGSMESKNALLEAKVEMLAEELQKVKEENKALEKKLEETELKAEMAKNELQEIIQKNGQKLQELANEIALLREMQKKEETTSSSDQMEKEWPLCLRLLPSETWTNIFGFVPRPQLAELVPEIGDWHFAEKAQYYLHEFGRITLGNLDIRRSTSWVNRKNGIPIPIVKFFQYEYNAYKPGWEYPLADVPIPKNIIEFGSIHISYFNESVLGFLQEFHRNSLMTNVNLSLYKTNANVDSDALSKLVPMLTSIEQLNLFNIDIEAFIQKEYSKAILETARVLFIHHKLDDEWYCRWLCTPREDGKPRVLSLQTHADRSIFAFIEHIKKDFMDSIEAATFFIHFRGFRNAGNVQSDSLENNKTSERLVITGNDQPFRHMTIARNPQANGQWIEDMGKYWYCEHRYINVEI